METIMATIGMGHVAKDFAAILCGAENFFQKSIFIFFSETKS